MEDGEPAVGIFVPPDLRLDIVVSVAIGGDLQRAALAAHGVVVGDDPQLLLEQLTERDWKLVGKLRGKSDDPLFGDHLREDYQNLYSYIIQSDAAQAGAH